MDHRDFPALADIKGKPTAATIAGAGPTNITAPALLAFHANAAPCKKLRAHPDANDAIPTALRMTVIQEIRNLGANQGLVRLADDWNILHIYCLTRHTILC